MKQCFLPLWLALISPAQSALELPYLFTPSSSDEPNRLSWATEPGRRYDLWESAELAQWDRVEGFPRTAGGLALSHAFAPASGGRRFFRIGEIDDQPPVVSAQYPAVNGFAVGRFADLVIELADASGIDPGSVRLTVGATGPLAAGAPGLSNEGGTVTYDSGDAALGGWGETITATLVVADTAGHTLTHAWSFRLEPQPVTADNIFVFGSPAAQRAGQRVEGPAAALAARFPAPTGPVRANDGADWCIESVAADRIVIAYGDSGPPVFSADQLLCNLAPASLDEILYRKLVSTNDDSAAKRLTLHTADAPLEQFIEQGAIGLSPDSVIYEADGAGRLIRALAFTGERTFAPLGPDFSGEVLWSSGGANLRLDEARCQLTPAARVSLEIENSELRRFEAGLRGEVRSAIVPALHYAASASYASSRPLANLHRVVFVGAVGPVPIWLDLNFALAAQFNAAAGVQASFSGGARQDFDFGFGGRYVRGATPAVAWEHSVAVPPLDIVPFSYTINGTASGEIRLVPSVSLRINSLAGVTANLNPRFGFTGEATVTNGELESAEWELYAKANLNLGLSVAGVDAGDLPSTSISLYSKNWMVVYPEELQIRQQPQSVSLQEGEDVTLEVVAVGPGGVEELSYQWHHNGLPLPGRTDSQLLLEGVSVGLTGNYHVRVTAAPDSLDSDIAVVSLALDSFAFIPSGPFTMGNTFGNREDIPEGTGDELPLHMVDLDAFSIGKHEVTKALWDDVRAWAEVNGYTDLAIGSLYDGAIRRGPLHPVHNISWFDAVKWCNARSEKEGLTPCYRAGGQIYRTGNNNDVACDWGVNGYRLPTEAEWEKAARGGTPGNRYPWGNNISHAQANYRAFGPAEQFGNLSGDVGFHPAWVPADQNDLPYTAPGGSFPANGYGLFDVTGNLSEWCWDWFDIWFGSWSQYYLNSPPANPRGPDNGNARVYRGGHYGAEPIQARVAYRGGDRTAPPTTGDHFLGFRLARSSVP